MASLNQPGAPLPTQLTAKKSLALISAALALCAFCLPACKKTSPPDYKIYQNMGDSMQAKLEAAGAQPRGDMPELFQPGRQYIKNLHGLVRLVFGSPRLQVYLQSWESPKIAVASISQFEVPPGSDTYTDCAFVVRPAADLAAPIMHGDKRAPMAGSSDDLSMDFYNYEDPDDTGYVDGFFGQEQIARLNEALDLVEQYQKIGEDRGKYTPYLGPYKSKYRLELALPKDSDEAQRKAYFDAALQAYKLYQDAYFTALANAVADTDAAAIAGRKTAAGAFIDLLEEEDAAYKLGKMLFGDDISQYFNDGFWREGYYGE